MNFTFGLCLGMLIGIIFMIVWASLKTDNSDSYIKKLDKQIEMNRENAETFRDIHFVLCEIKKAIEAINL